MPDPRTAYIDLPDAASGPAVSRVERALLAELLAEVGPDQPTLCEGWTTHHLAAHLKIREGDPLDQARNLLRSDASVESAVRSTDYDALVRRISDGPPLLSLFRVPKVEPTLNSLEYFIHHEDVRRARAGWAPRTLPMWAQDQLWRATVGFTKLALRNPPVPVSIERTDTGERVEVSGGDGVVLRGLPGEIALYLYGRRDVADIEVVGSDEAVAAFTRRDSGV